MSQGQPASTPVLMPSMGEGVTEATLVRWLVEVGSTIAKGAPLLEVSTDKVDTEIPAPASGYLVATFAGEGETLLVNSTIAQISEEKDAEIVAPAPHANPSVEPAREASDRGPTPFPKPKEAAAGLTSQASAGAVIATPAIINDGDIRSSPLVRKIAAERGVDLRRVPGTGLGGRITKQDVELFIARGGLEWRYGPADGAGSMRLDTQKEGDKEYLDGVPVRREKMSKMRRLIAEHMVRSVRTSAHVTMNFEIDMHRIVAQRDQHKAEFRKREGFALTYTPYFIRAAVEAIKVHPIVNVSVDGDDILWKDEINFGCAVALDSGLIVPVIKEASSQTLLGIARALNDLVTRARSKQLNPDDVVGGTFSLTNPGMFGSYVASPIINQPQVAILSVNAITSRAAIIDNEIAIRPLVQVGLTFDHRVIDGEAGARYLATLKDILESWSEVPH